MTWSAQVWHVAAKDLRMMRWAVAAYVVVVGVAAAAATSWSLPAAWMPAVLLSGVLCIALAVQADSAYRSDAFWVTHPLSPAAVFAAKIAVAMILVLIGLMGQAVALAAHDIATAEFAAQLAVSLVAYAGLLTGAALIAAITPNLRTAVPVMIVAMIVPAIVHAYLLTAFASQAAEAGTGVLLEVLGLAGPAAVVAYMYHSRNHRRGIVLAGILVTSTTVMAAMPAASTRSEQLTDAPAEVRAQLRPMSDRPGMKVTRRGLLLQPEMDGGSEDHSYELTDVSAWLEQPDGKMEPLRLDGQQNPGRSLVRHWLYIPRVRTVDGVEWIADPPGPRGATLEVDLENDQRAAVVNGARVMIKGVIHVREPRVIATLPLRPGSRIVADGHRVRVLRAAAGPDGITASVFVSRVSLTGESRSYGGSREQPTMAVLQPDSAEAMPLMNWGGSTTTGLGLVLPGPEITRGRTELRAQTIFPSESVQARSPHWLSGAELVLIEWQSLGSYPVRFSVSGPFTRM